nr:hypothetical protein [Kiritimatiellia bacterium]
MNRILILCAILGIASAARASESATEEDLFHVNGMLVDPAITTDEPQEERIRPKPLRISSLADDKKLTVASINPLPVTPENARLAEVYLQRVLRLLHANQAAEALLMLRDGLALNPRNARLLAYAAI